MTITVVRAIGLEYPFVSETVVASVRHDNVVDEADVHRFPSFFDELRQLPVGIAWCGVAGRMVVNECYLRGTLQQSLAKDGAHVGTSLVYASAADADFADRKSVV